MKIGRVVLLVRDFQESLGFYRDVLGFRLLEEPSDNWASFDAGTASLSIAGPFPGMPYDPKSLGETPDQMMFLVDDVTRAAEDLRAKGVVVGEPFSPGAGVLLAEFRDPDGRYLAFEQRS
jgi:catechol 2,3-dioxygenase-like lactoylglutathione lyase family enzyme